MVVEFDWVDDFGKARQASYDALPDWVNFTLWADADDVIEGAELLRQLAARMPAAIGEQVLQALDRIGHTMPWSP